MMLDSIDNGPLVYPTVEENTQTRPKKYSELAEAQQLQDDCDVQETNIILHGLPPDVYALVNHQELEPKKLAPPANVPTSRDARVSLSIVKESTVTPASKYLNLSTKVALLGTSHVLDDVAEVIMVGSERVSSGLIDVVVALFAGEKSDGSLPSSIFDEEVATNPSRA
nr:hypothetical protein [Tanacetum cinerariifolium]